MAVKVLKNFPPLQNLPLTTRELMREVGLLTREIIIARTQGGRDAEGAPFHPYSRGYAAQKHKALGTSSPNLQVSGAMLQGLAILSVTDDSVEVGYKA